MKTILSFLLLVAMLLISGQSYSQCNTNISICTPGQAGPFNFAPASPNPSSCLDFTAGAASPNYAYIILYITQGGDLNLLIEADNNSGYLDVAVFDITGQTDPCASLGVGTELGCNYAIAPNGCNQFGNTFPCTSTVPAPAVNTGDVIMILVEDWSDVQTTFTLELGTAPGSAETGPPDATITPQAVLCTTDAPVQFTAVDNGGTWTGTGISPTGVFDPSSVPPGTYNIDYTIGASPCDDQDATTVTVIDCSAVLPCPEYANTATASNQACGGQLFDFEVLNSACNGLLTFDVVGNYGSTFGSEITWEVTSNLTGNVLASGGPGFDGGTIGAVVNVDPAVEGTFFTMEIFDSFGDGFNGTGGFYQIEQNGTIISGPITGDFGTGASNIFGANVSISTSTLTINTPSGPIVNQVGNCLDHDVQFQLDNANYCNPINVNLPWEIVCDETGGVISSGTHTVTVYPQIPTASSDLIDISWNTGTCQWDVVGQNDCDVLDIGTIFNITPNPFAWPANTCTGGTENFTVDYIGVSGGPDCCSTGGSLVPIQYQESTTVSDVTVGSTPFGGVNNGAYSVIGPNGSGGAATSLNLTVDMTGYCFPTVPGTSTDEYWVTVIVDGNIIYDQVSGPPAPANFNETFNLGAIPGGYTQNSTIEVWVYPNFFSTNPPAPLVNATYVPGGACGSLAEGEWTASTIDVTLDVTFTEQMPTAANCSFVQAASYTCCTTTPLTASNPATINVQCSGDVPAPDPLVVTDATGPCNPAVAFLSETSDGLTCPETITRTYQITNDCGDVFEVQQLIVVNDTQAPVLTSPPAVIAVQCAANIPVMTNLNWTDNCDGAGTVTGSDVSDGQSCPETITRTWTYTDACGNTATETQIITVNDTQTPVFTVPPVALNVQCSGDVPAMTNLNWTDNCDGAGTVTGSDVSDGQSCPETITRTWTYTDACGNTATEIQIITVNDTQTPVFTAPPAALNVQCSGDVPAMTNLGWTDNCDGAGTVTGSDVSDGQLCPETITRTWTYTDACGNTSTATQTIVVDDTTPPTGSNPMGISLTWGTPIPPADPLVVNDEADNCTVNPTVAFVSDVSDNGNCPEIITRTYSITDACGNQTLVTQLITIGDAILPTASNPTPINVQCSADVPAPDPLVVNDESDNGVMPPVVTFESDISDGQSCPETITRTYRVTDDCGNFIFVTQTITILDIEAPVFNVPPANTTVQCSADLPAMTSLGWTDNCDGTGVVTGSDVSDGLSCPETITRTWTYTDACGNTATETQIIIINDTQLPVFTAPPVALNVQCSADVPAMSDLGWTDNCDGSGTVTGADVSDGQSCPETITRTWTYTDACGNTAIETQIITINDTQAPVFVTSPATLTVECSADVPVMTDLDWTDNCDGVGTVIGVDISDGLSCPETITRSWTYTDACGNTSTVSQTIIVDDTTPPTASNPSTTTIPAGTPIPAVDVTVVNDEADNCTSNPQVTFISEVSDNNPCPETITRIYEITDDCGNTTQVTHLVVITDPMMPMGTAPAPINVECIGDVPAADPLLITDEADNQGAPVVAHVGDVSDGQSCPETITRTYSITDVCGNQITVDQLITIFDVTAPIMAQAPLDITVECIGDVPTMMDLGWTDNCDGTGIVTGIDFSDGQSCPETITRTWSYTDACGNISSVSQIITVIDTQAPVFAVPPAALNVECIGDVPAMMDLDWTDNCDGAGTVTGSDVSDGQSCPETITRTWTYTDACGNTSSVNQIITVQDTQVPVFSAPPANTNVECIGDVPVMAALDWMDNCDGTGTVTGTDVSDGQSCPETITRTWTYTDACGNTSSVSQTITIQDLTPPTASSPTPISVPGVNDVPAPDPNVITTEADNCTANPVVAFVSEVSDGNVCNNELITQTYSVTDDCGNQTLVTFEITILAAPAPIDAGNDTTICVGETITIVPNNPWNVPVAWSPALPQGPLAPTQTTTYTVTADHEGCLSTDQITITVEEPPIVSFVGDELYGCAPHTVNFTNTSTSVSGMSDCLWTINGETISGCNSGSYTFENGGSYDVTLTVTSLTGCAATETYTDYIYVEDEPLAAFTPSQTVMSSQYTEVIFSNNSVGATGYEWMMGDGGSMPDMNPTYTFPEVAPASYNVVLVASTDLGCIDTAWATLVVNEELIYYVPNTFTPDNDDFNETFLPVFSEGYDPFDYHLMIFNRWGEVIWESYDASIGWDGTYSQFGNEVQDGTYTWKIEFKTTMNDERVMSSGHVNVIR